MAKQQSGDKDVGVQHDPRSDQSCRLAHATASFTSSSVMPSSASFWRTASARLSRKGTNTIRPFSSLALKQSTPGNNANSLSGSVSCFVAVSFANIVMAPSTSQSP